MTPWLKWSKEVYPHSERMQAYNLVIQGHPSSIALGLRSHALKRIVDFLSTSWLISLIYVAHFADLCTFLPMINQWGTSNFPFSYRAQSQYYSARCSYVWIPSNEYTLEHWEFIFRSLPLWIQWTAYRKTPIKTSDSVPSNPSQTRCSRLLAKIRWTLGWKFHSPRVICKGDIRIEAAASLLRVVQASIHRLYWILE